MQNSSVGKRAFSGVTAVALHFAYLKLTRQTTRRSSYSRVPCVFAEEEKERERERGGEGKRETEFPSLPLTVAAHGRYTAITRRCIDPAVRSPTVRRIPRARWRATLSLPIRLLRSETPFHSRKRGKRERGPRDDECVSSPDGRAGGRASERT